MGKLLAILFVAWLLFGNGLTTLSSLSGTPAVRDVAQTIVTGAERLKDDASAPARPAAVQDLFDRLTARGGIPPTLRPAETAALSTTAKLAPAVLTAVEPRSPVNDQQFTARPEQDRALIVETKPAIEQGAPVEVPVNAGAFDKAAPAPEPVQPAAEPALVEVAPAPAVEQAPVEQPIDKCAQSPAACASGG
jgi:hypothetical protein